MTALYWLGIILNLVFVFIIAWFTSRLSWNRKEDKSSIIGFSIMIGVYVLNIALMIWGVLLTA